MRTLKKLTSEDEKLLNQILKKKKSSKYTLLYYSEWDFWSDKILNLTHEWVQREGDEVCYLISSWELPHAFAAFSITSSPTVVEVNDGVVKVHVEYPKVHSFFSPPKPKKKRKKKRGPRNRAQR